MYHNTVCVYVYVCVQLLMDKELSVLIRQLYFVVLDKLCTEHFHTALEIAQSCEYIHMYSLQPQIQSLSRARKKWRTETKLSLSCIGGGPACRLVLTTVQLS